jgi:hypothetical protein
MKHFHRTSVAPADVLHAADGFFTQLGMTMTANAPRGRTFVGPLGAVRIMAGAEGGHYTFVELQTDQIGESRLDRNVKKFFVQLHRQAEPRHALEAGY